MSPSTATGSAELDASSQPPQLRISGDWTLAHYADLERRVETLAAPLPQGTRIDLAALAALDTAGASLLVRLLGPDRIAELAQADGLPPARRAMLDTVGKALDAYRIPAKARRRRSAVVEVLARIGRAMDSVWQIGRAHV